MCWSFSLQQLQPLPLQQQQEGELLGTMPHSTPLPLLHLPLLLATPPQACRPI